MKAKNFSIAKRADHLAITGTTKSVCRIKQQSQLVALGNFGHGPDSARATPKMNANDAGRARRYLRFNPRQIEIMRLRIDVTEHRSNPMPLKRVCGGDKGK